MTQQPSVLDSVNQWISHDWLSQLDRAFVRFLLDQDAAASDLVLWAGALVSHQLGSGEVYLDLEKLCKQPALTLAIPSNDGLQSDTDELLNGLSSLKDYKLEHWKTALSQSSLVGSGYGNTPLVVEGNRLYLRRYW